MRLTKSRATAVLITHEHDLSDVGVDTVDWWLDTKGGAGYARIPLGASVDLQVQVRGRHSSKTDGPPSAHRLGHE